MPDTSTHEPKTELGQRIWDELVELRVIAGVTQAEMSRRMNYARNMLSLVESGHRGRYNLEILERYAGALGYKIQFRVVPKARSDG